MAKILNDPYEDQPLWVTILQLILLPFNWIMFRGGPPPMSDPKEAKEFSERLSKAQLEWGKHPRPAPSQLFYNPNSRMLMDDSHREIAIMYEWHDLKNNVEFIVKAVNSYTAHRALIEELQMMLEGVLETNLWKDDGMRHYEKLTSLCNDALAKSRKVLGGTE